MELALSKLGESWETQIRVANDLLRRDELACVHKTNPTVRVLSKPIEGKFEACFSEEGPPDFIGLIKTNGRHVVFDAKATDGDTFPLKMIKRHQAMALEAAAPMGFSFIALLFKREGWVLPWWRALSPMWWDHHQKRTKKASLNLADIRRIGWRMPGPGDWFRALPVEIRGDES